MKGKYIEIGIIGIFIVCFILLLYLKYGPKDTTNQLETNDVDSLVVDSIYRVDSTKQLPEDYLMEVLKQYDIKHPHIVYAQAILETGYFTSKVYKDKNNLFGLFDSYNMDYFSFPSWQSSVSGYKRLFQYKYKSIDNATDEDYYKFLQDFGYAEDPYYISKLRKIVKRNNANNRYKIQSTITN